MKDEAIDNSFYNGVRATHTEMGFTFKFFYHPLDRHNRYCKIQFNPSQAGLRGLECIQSWYDTIFYLGAFEGLLNGKNCIKVIECSKDIITPHRLSDFDITLKKNKPFCHFYDGEGNLVAIQTHRKDKTRDRWIEYADTSAHSKYNIIRLTRQF